jgi:nicotinamidase-related amidase
MLSAFGRRIPVTVDDLLREPCALVVWDMHVGIATRATNFQQLLRTIPPLIAAARSRDVPVIFSQHYSLPLACEDRPWIRTMWERGGRGDPARPEPAAADR